MTSKYFTCPFCHENSPVRSSATDRVDLERDRGEKFMATCIHCHKPRSVHVNEVSAQPNVRYTYVAAGIAVLATIAMWRFGFLAYLTVAFPFLVHRVQTDTAATFNGYSLPRKS